MKSRFLLLLIVTLLFTINVKSQIGINTLNPDTSAALDVYSIDKGLLIPRLSAVQREALPMKYAPANGLMVYDTTYSMFFYWSKNHWEAVNTMQFTVDELGNNSNLVLKSHTINNKNVGIGIDIPLQKLHVNGNIQAEGNVIATQNITAGSNISASGNMSANNFTANTNITASQTITATNFVGDGTIPVGGIIMWSGTAVPDGWALCNGQITNGIQTPNLTDRFIIGSGGSYSTNNSGGTSTHNHPMQFSATSSFTGSQATISVSGTVNPVQSGYANGNPLWVGGLSTVLGCTHVHTFSTSSSYTPGGNVSTTVYSGIGNNNTTNETNVLPPYYALAFIMRVR
jgi:hypothetical protein